jgi:hypothetical protein
MWNGEPTFERSASGEAGKVDLKRYIHRKMKLFKTSRGFASYFLEEPAGRRSELPSSAEEGSLENPSVLKIRAGQG